MPDGTWARAAQETSVPDAPVTEPPGSGGRPPLGEFAGRRFAVPGPWPSWTVFERLGGLLAFLFAVLGVPPSVVTALGGALGVAGAIALGSAADGGGQVLAVVLLLSSYALDCADGQLARATGRSSAWGGWLDVTADGVVIAFVTSALTIAFTVHGAPEPWGLVLAGAYGASRTANLLTSMQVRAEQGGMALTGFRDVLRKGYTSVIDTPVTYLALCVAVSSAGWLGAVVAVLAVMTAVQVVTSASHHHRRTEPDVPLGL
jgi:phosphatidylglycerophosphate synthase